MSSAKSNGLLKILLLVIVVVVIFVVVIALKRGSNAEISTTPSEVAYDLSAEEQKSLGITAGDTPHDTIKTLLGAIKETRADMQKVVERNEKLEKENNTLKANGLDIEERLSAAIEAERNNLLTAFEQRINELTNNANTNQSTNNAMGIGVETATENLPIGGGMSGHTTSPETGTRWVEPDDIVKTDKQGKLVGEGFLGETQNSFPNPFKALDESILGDAAATAQNGLEPATKARQESTKTAVFTLPQNATLMGSVAMTALLGRVPLEGNLVDPYPFKIMVGADNLIANGVELPDVEGAIVSGTASGDWALSCVRGEIRSITFVFNDGRIAQSRSEKNGEKSLGWISNPQGVPCIPGERKTNAPEYLSTQFLLSGASAAAQSFAQSQTTTVVDGNSVVGAVTGNQGKYILGQAIGGGLTEMTDWLRKRFGQTFDAVYVPPGQAVAIHLNENVEIDYDSSARKVKYHSSQQNRQLD